MQFGGTPTKNFPRSFHFRLKIAIGTETRAISRLRRK